MSYQKQVEPLKRYEVFLAGMFLQIFVVFLKVLPFGIWSVTCRTAVFTSDIQSEEDLEQVHGCISKYRSHLLLSATVYLLGYPLIIAHLYFQNRKEETVLSTFFDSKYNFLRWLYNGSWMLIAIIKCIVVPAMLIFIVYYDWELSETYKYVGYAWQFQFLHLLLILMDTVFIPLGVAASIPWIFQIMLLFPNKTNIEQMTDETRKQIIGPLSKCNRNGKIIFAITAVCCVLIILFASFGDVFDYDKRGFFSLSGDSQYLWVIIYTMLQLQCMSYMRLSCRMKKEVFENQ